MNRFFYTLIMMLLAGATAWIVTGYRAGTTSTVQTESAYDRVIRTGTLRCGYMPWPVFIEKDAKTGELKGLLKDVIDQMMGTINIKVDYVEAVLGQQPQDLETGKYDSFCFDSFLMPKASKYIDYSKPWTYMPMFLYGLNTQPSKDNLQDFNTPDYTFSTLDGDTSLDLAVRFFPQAKLLSLANNADPSLLMLNLATRKADLVIIDTISIQQFEKENGPHFKKLYAEPLAVYPFNFSVKKGEIGLQNMIDYAIDIFIYTGTYKATLDRYDPGQVMTRIDNQRK